MFLKETPSHIIKLGHMVMMPFAWLISKKNKGSRVQPPLKHIGTEGDGGRLLP